MTAPHETWTVLPHGGWLLRVMGFAGDYPHVPAHVLMGSQVSVTAARQRRELCEHFANFHHRGGVVIDEGQHLALLAFMQRDVVREEIGASGVRCFGNACQAEMAGAKLMKLGACST
jgi:hypothetical protein